MASHQELKARQRRERHTHSPSVALRVHRSLSWFGRAEKERTDDDARFVFLWIAFNAVCATESHDLEITEKCSFKSFLRTPMKLDTRGYLGYLIWREFPNSIRMLLKNEFVFTDFWQHHTGQLTAAEWESRFKTSRRAVELALVGGDTLQEAVIHRSDFRCALYKVETCDLVFLDPPYLYGDDQIDQQSYNVDRFGAADGRFLAEKMRRLVDLGANVIFCWGERSDALVPAGGIWAQIGRDHVWRSDGLALTTEIADEKQNRRSRNLIGGVGPYGGSCGSDQRTDLL